MKDTASPSDASSDDRALDDALRLRRSQRLAVRADPTDPASGTSRVAAMLAKARADALAAPLEPREVIDLT